MLDMEWRVTSKVKAGLEKMDWIKCGVIFLPLIPEWFFRRHYRYHVVTSLNLNQNQVKLEHIQDVEGLKNSNRYNNASKFGSKIFSGGSWMTKK